MRLPLFMPVTLLLIACPLLGQGNPPGGYDFILEVAGYQIQRQLRPAEDSSIGINRPDGSFVQATIERVSTEALLETPQSALRDTVYLQIIEKNGTSQCTTFATANLCSKVAIVRNSAGNPSVVFAADPATMVVTADPPQAQRTEQMVWAMAPEIAKRLSLRLDMGALTIISRAMPANAPAIQADVYQMGFTWILQLYAPVQAGASPPPRSFLIGDTFTLISSPAMAQMLFAGAAANGRLPRKLNAGGLPDSSGTISVTGASLALDNGEATVNWQGVNPSGQRVCVVWKAGFENTANGAGLALRSIQVDGVPQAVPASATHIDPLGWISAMQQPDTGWVLAGPLGVIRVREGEIRSDGVLIAGFS